MKLVIVKGLTIQDQDLKYWNQYRSITYIIKIGNRAYNIGNIRNISNIEATSDQLLEASKSNTIYTICIDVSQYLKIWSRQIGTKGIRNLVLLT